jgi:SAM-dependent methyltransferase
MARHGAAKVYGIDISSVAIENARKLAESAGVAHICEFKVMDAENTEFEDAKFDIIHEYGALHHLYLPAAFKELSRVMKSDGRLVCTEALRHNPFIHCYRKLTPELRTKWEAEHILGIPEIKNGNNYFGACRLKTFHLTALAAVPFRRTGFFKRLLACLNAIDNSLLKFPYIYKMAWVAVVEYKKPIQIR